jgi:hypothetical protein
LSTTVIDRHYAAATARGVSQIAQRVFSGAYDAEHHLDRAVEQGDHGMWQRRETGCPAVPRLRLGIVEPGRQGGSVVIDSIAMPEPLRRPVSASSSVHRELGAGEAAVHADAARRLDRAGIRDCQRRGVLVGAGSGAVGGDGNGIC